MSKAIHQAELFWGGAGEISRPLDRASVRRSRTLLTFAVAAFMVLVPSVSFAASATYGVDSTDGYGTTRVLDSARNGWSGTSTWRAYETSKPVYVSGEAIWNSYVDKNCGRISDNAFTGFKTQAVSCVDIGRVGPSSDAAGVRLCRDKPNATDPCGDYRRINY